MRPQLRFLVVATALVLPVALVPGPGAAAQASTGSGSAALLSEVPRVRVSTLALDLLPGARSGQAVRTARAGHPFSLVGLRWPGQAPDEARFRVRTQDGWGPWHDLEPTDTARASGGASEPVWTGQAQEVQVRALRDGAPASDVALVLVDPGRAPREALPRWARDAAVPARETAVPMRDGPRVISRAQWGADESLRCLQPAYDDRIVAVTLHHTAESNDYTREESAAVVRAIYTYHARTLGWCDIGYNALVDRYGQIFEGRAGGLDRGVIGAHAGGFNRHTSGVAMMGTFTDTPPPPELVDALTAFLDWKLALHRIDPLGQVQLVSQGGGTSRFPAGAPVMLPVLFGHRDVGATACPGDAGYALLPRLRSALAATPAPD